MSHNESVEFTYVGYSDGVLGSHNDWPDLDPRIGLANWWTHDYTKWLVKDGVGRQSA